VIKKGGNDVSELKQSLSLSLYPSTKERLKLFKEESKLNYDEAINFLVDLAEEKKLLPKK